MSLNNNNKASLDRFIEYMKLSGMRVTPERLTIARAALDLGKHFNADDLVHRLHKKKVSRATVYRCLPLLVKAGVIRRIVQHGGHGEFERARQWAPHGHLTCTNCGSVEEFTENTIEELQKRVFPKFGFEPIEYMIDIRGWCRKCTARRKRTKR